MGMSYSDYDRLISEYEATAQKWEKRAEKIGKKYKDEDRQQKKNGASRFNILWSNTQILIPATFSRIPRPDVSRRHKDTDPVGRVAALILERALEYEVSVEPDFSESMKAVVQDRFLGGRGTAWVRYDPRFEPADDFVQVSEDQENEAGEGNPEILAWEHSPVDYVHWRDFGHSVARTWAEVTAVWRKVYMGRDALVDRFGKDGESIPLDTTPEELKSAGKNLGDGKHSQALIYEIWDKASGEAVWLSKSLGKIVDCKPDPLKLPGFWPCPRPLFATLTNDSLIPTPDYALYQDQARTLDTLAERIDGLVQSLKVTGCYDASSPEIARLFTEGENGTLIPVKSWAAFVERNGLNGAVDIVDLAPIAAALRECYLSSEQIKGQIYEITGISDILRGASDPNETLGAQRIKASSGSLRIRTAQEDVARFATDLLRIKAQIMCNFYSPEILAQMAAVEQMQPVDQQMIQPAMALLKSGSLRGFRVEIEADSMVMLDEQMEKQSRMEFLQATGAFIKEAMPVVSQAPELANLAMEMLKFGVTGYRVGKTLQGVFDQTADQIKQAVQQKQANPQPSPDQMKAQADIQMKQAELAAQTQADQAKMQHEIALEQFKAEQEMRVEAFRQQAQQAQYEAQQRTELQADMAEEQRKFDLDQMRMQMEERMQGLQQQVQILIAQLNNAARVEVAEIGAQATLDAGQMAAANAASTEGAG